MSLIAKIRRGDGLDDRQVPTEITNILNDVLGLSGGLYFLIYEEFSTKVDQLLPPLGMVADKQLDFKKELIKVMDRISNLSLRISMRIASDAAFERNKDHQYALYLAIKALCRLTPSEVSDYAIRMTRNEPNFTMRSHFMNFFEAVLERSRTSNHDAVQMIKKLYEVLSDDQDERVVYDYNIKDFKLSDIDSK